MLFVDALRDALDVQVGVVSRLSVSDYERGSGCAGWTIRMVLNHSVGVTQKFTEFAAGKTDAPRTPAGDLLGDDPRRAVRAAVKDSALAWAVADLGRTCALPFAQVDGYLAAGINLYDVMAHTWDIAAPRHLAVECDDGLWQAALAAAEAALAIGRDPRHFAPPLPVGANATTRERFLAALGRAERQAH